MIWQASFLVQLFSCSLLGLAFAYTTPTTQCNGCNPIANPGLQELVPVAEPYTIRWTPTTTGTITILLLRGPSTDVVPLYAIVDKAANSGSYDWTPSTDLVPDVSHYGIQLINDSDGTFQYSTQFGISNPSPNNVASSSSASSVASTTATSQTSSAKMTASQAASTSTSALTQQTTTSTSDSLASTTVSPASSSSAAPVKGASSLLSTGAKIAIGAGIGVVAVAVIASILIFFVLPRRRHVETANLSDASDERLPLDGGWPLRQIG